MKAQKKVLMNHALAKALLDAGIEHYDGGGMVAPVAPAPVQGPATTQSGDPGWLGRLLGQNNYSANLAPVQQSSYGTLINNAATNAMSGFDRSNDVQAQQQELAKALLAQSRGEGPDPASAALNAETGKNVANTAALMAGARGAGSNVGLMARNAAQAGAGIQQNAVGQTATLKAQQQLAAEGALQSQQQAMASGNLAEQGVNASLLGTGAAAQHSQNEENIQNYGMVQGINSGVAGGNAKNGAGILGGIINGAASALTLADGGEVPTSLPDHLHAVAKIYHPTYVAGVRDFRSGGPVPGRAAVKGNSIKNDTVPAMVSPKEVVLPRSVTMSKNAPSKAAEFMKHIQDKKGGSDAKFAPSGRSAKTLKERVEMLEKMVGKSA